MSSIAMASTGSVSKSNFSKAFADIQEYYVFPVPSDGLYDNAIRGMLSGLDPHCAFLTKEDLSELKKEIQGHFAGIGLDVTMDHGLIQVISALPGTPAEKAGIRPGDYIIMLDTTSVQGLTLRSAVNRMRGPENTEIRLTLVRKDESQAMKSFQIVLKRKMIIIPNIKSELLDEAYGYIKLMQFQDLTDDELITAVEKLKKQTKMRGFILDLRDNPGGLFDSGVAVADAFIDGKKKNTMKIVSTKGRAKDTNTTVFAKPGDILNDVPMIVLVNRGTASAAEIVAGALKDNHRAVILGTKTFGKGSVQTMIPLNGDNVIKLTTALYFTPSGVSIQAKGITPNIVVKQMIFESNNVDSNENNEDITEANLAGHLTIDNNSQLASVPNSTPNSTNAQNTHGLIYKDYQLYQALNILKGVALADQFD